MVPATWIPGLLAQFHFIAKFLVSWQSHLIKVCLHGAYMFSFLPCKRVSVWHQTLAVGVFGWKRAPYCQSLSFTMLHLNLCLCCVCLRLSSLCAAKTGASHTWHFGLEASMNMRTMVNDSDSAMLYWKVDTVHTPENVFYINERNVKAPFAAVSHIHEHTHIHIHTQHTNALARCRMVSSSRERRASQSNLEIGRPSVQQLGTSTRLW